MDHTVAPELVSFASSLVDASGAVIRDALSGPRTIHAKADESPVTEVDRAVERRLRELIAARYPTHGIHGEEFGVERSGAEYVWVLDPIDGTKAFMIGFPAFGTLVALLRDGRPVLGVIDQPVSGERWVGAAGAPTLYQGSPVRTRDCDRLSDATICTTTAEYYTGRSANGWRRLRDATRWCVFGGNCIFFGQLARGYVDVALEAGVGVYDYLALVPIVEGAGGAATDWEGRSLSVESGERFVCSGTPALHAAVLECLARD